MSTGNQSQFCCEEEEIAKGARAMEDPKRCSICLQPKAPNSPSNKCDQCLDKIDKVPTGFQNQNKTIERLEERMDKLEVENKDLMDKYETQSNLLIKNTKEIESLKNENENLNQMLQQQNDNVLNNHQKLQLLEKENPKDIETSLNEQKKDIENLKTFAKAVGELHETLSDTIVREKIKTNRYLYDTDYIKNEEAKQWNDLVQQINTNKDFNGDCDYLQQMKNVMNRYQDTVYSKSWRTRLVQFACAIDQGVMINNHIKLYTDHNVKCISVIDHNTYDDFNRTTQDIKWTKHSDGVASYLSEHQGSLCLNVAVMLPSWCKNVYILHWDEEDKKLKFPLDGTVTSFNGDDWYHNPFAMLQLEE